MLHYCKAYFLKDLHHFDYWCAEPINGDMKLTRNWGSTPIHDYPFKLAHNSLWFPYKMEALCLCHHPFKTSFFLERGMTYPGRLQKISWPLFVRTNITL